MQTLLLSWMLVLGALTGASTNFPVDMFETTSHQFGTVVKGAKTEFDFVFTNKYVEDVEIESVSSSCQCTTPSFSPRGPIKTHEQGKIHISVNTQNFVGNKNATITVRFAKPYRTEMQLHSYVYIRSDVYINPGIIYFGSVDPSTKPVISVNVNSVTPGWKIEDVQSECKFLGVELNSTGNSSYRMNVRLRENAPPGPFSEVLEIITNDYDQRSKRIPVRVEGRIKQTLSANPSPLAFNFVEQGKKVEKTVIVQGAEPFTIRDITSENRYISASIDPTPQKIQKIKLVYKGEELGDFQGTMNVITSLENGMSTDINFNGKVVPPSKPEPEPEATEPTPAEPEKTPVKESEKVSEAEETTATPEKLNEGANPMDLMALPEKSEETTEEGKTEALPLNLEDESAEEAAEKPTEEPVKETDELNHNDESAEKPAEEPVKETDELNLNDESADEPAEKPAEEADESKLKEEPETPETPEATDGPTNDSESAPAKIAEEEIPDLIPEEVQEDSESASNINKPKKRPGRNLLKKK